MAFLSSILLLTTAMLLIYGFLNLLASALMNIYPMFINFGEDGFGFIFPFFGDFYDSILVFGMSLFVLILTFQTLKSMFAYLGFEAVDTPSSLFLRSIPFGFLTFYSREIILFIMDNFFRPFMNLIVEANLKANPENINIFATLKANMSPTIDFEKIIGIIMAGYLTAKLFFIVVKFCERLILISLMTLCAPIAFACGVSKATSSHFKSFIKVYGSLFMAQMIQVILIYSLIPMVTSNLAGGSLYSILRGGFILLGLIKVIEGVEGMLGNVNFSSVLSSGPRDIMGQISTFTTTLAQANTGLSKFMGK